MSQVCQEADAIRGLTPLEASQPEFTGTGTVPIKRWSFILTVGPRFLLVSNSCQWSIPDSEGRRDFGSQHITASPLHTTNNITDTVPRGILFNKLGGLVPGSAPAQRIQPV
mmetsp:Transcript_436/g.799  ORF Transcript_436/g.799 Transcript_436/m.799 type:complete len:111 (-) Transcript_436:448-780(-)